MSISMKTRKRRGAVGAGIAVASLVTALGTGVSPAAAATSPTPESRAQALLAQMTLEEKVDMLEGERNNYYGFYNAPIERLGIPALTMADGPAGVRIANPRPTLNFPGLSFSSRQYAYEQILGPCSDLQYNIL
jgi:beta-glucosidase